MHDDGTFNIYCSNSGHEKQRNRTYCNFSATNFDVPQKRYIKLFIWKLPSNSHFRNDNNIHLHAQVCTLV